MRQADIKVGETYWVREPGYGHRSETRKATVLAHVSKEVWAPGFVQRRTGKTRPAVRIRFEGGARHEQTVPLANIIESWTQAEQDKRDRVHLWRDREHASRRALRDAVARAIGIPTTDISYIGQRRKGADPALENWAAGKLPWLEPAPEVVHQYLAMGEQEVT